MGPQIYHKMHYDSASFPLPGEAIMQQPENMRCINCTHFRNTPDYLESVFKGMNTMSSGHASVRKDDGICLENDVYLSASDWCDKFEMP